MNYRDQWATDEAGKQFVFTVEMQRALAEAGLPVEPEQIAKIKSQPESSRRNEGFDLRPTESAVELSTEEVDEELSEILEIQIDPVSGKYLGKIKWYNDSRGYGFVLRGGGEELFFHKSSTLMDSSELVEGKWVLYDVEEAERGVEATDVELFTGHGS